MRIESPPLSGEHTNRDVDADLDADRVHWRSGTSRRTSVFTSDRAITRASTEAGTRFSQTDTTASTVNLRVRKLDARLCYLPLAEDGRNVRARFRLGFALTLKILAHDEKKGSATNTTTGPMKGSLLLISRSTLASDVNVRTARKKGANR